MATPPNDPIASFRRSLREYTRQAKVCGRDYVLTKRFKDEHLREADINRLLSDIYRRRPGPPTEPITIYNHSRIVLAILIETELQNLDELVELFLRLEIEDGKLPYSQEELTRKIQLEDSLRSQDFALQVARTFCQTQWKFLAHKFGDREDVNIDARRILPIVDRKPIKAGGTAQLWEIVVLEDFVSETLRKTVSRSAFIPTQPGSDKDGRRYTFALKTFAATPDGSVAYRGEKAAFDGVRHRPGIVRCLGCYKQMKNGRSASGSPIYTNNILLEFGEMDLEEYFYEYDPPVLQDEIEKFWKLLFAVVKALQSIHNFERRLGEDVQFYKGWHADIKPANILFIHQVFKLADLGFAILVQEQTGSEPFKNELKGGTWSYGAPETLDPSRREAVTQAIDVWSLGCVFSEAASWMLGGSAAVKAFSSVRGRAVGRAKLPLAYMRELKSGDCFHDGRGVLQAVIDWHNVLRQSMRKNDNITGQVLDLVEKKMLLEDPAKRINVGQLSKELDAIIALAAKDDRYLVPKNIMDAFLTTDQSGSSDAALSAERQQRLLPVSALDRKQRKSRLLNTPLRQTAQRSNVLSSALGPDGTNKGRHSTDITIPVPSIEVPLQKIPESIERQIVPATSYIPPPSSHPAIPMPIPLTRSPPPGSTPAFPPNLPRPLRMDSQHSKQMSTTSAPQVLHVADTSDDASDRRDVFKARKALERMEKGMAKRTWRKLTGKYAKDPVLSRYFEERDIVFLVDNATSMLPYWENAEYLLTTLVWMCIGQDKDGMDLRFTSGDENLRNNYSRSDFEECMYRPSAMPSSSNKTDITVSLGTLFHRHSKSIKQRGGAAKALTVIVLTDGRWDGMTNKDSVKDKIASFVKEVTKGPMNQVNRPVSVQFIQLGRDWNATLRLRALDDELHDTMGIPDVVDHEPADGDVYKMILGSFVHEYDRRNNTSFQPPTVLQGDSILDQSFRESPSPVSSPRSEVPIEVAELSAAQWQDR